MMTLKELFAALFARKSLTGDPGLPPVKPHNMMSADLPAKSELTPAIQPPRPGGSMPPKTVEPDVLVRIEWGGLKRQMVKDLRKEPLRLYEQRMPLADLFKFLSPRIAALVPANTRTWKGVIVHHSATPDGKTADEEAITRFHTSWRSQGNIITKEQADKLIAEGKGQLVEAPWSDNGYNVLVELVDDAVTILLARPLSEGGGHCKQNRRNLTHIGLCFIGNFDAYEPGEVRLAVGAAICNAYKGKFGFNVSDVEPHRMHASYKQCPGVKFDMAALQARMNRHAGATS